APDSAGAGVGGDRPEPARPAHVVEDHGAQEQVVTAADGDGEVAAGAAPIGHVADLWTPARGQQPQVPAGGGSLHADDLLARVGSAVAVDVEKQHPATAPVRHAAAGGAIV